MKKHYVISFFTALLFHIYSIAQSHVYVYVSPDYGGCTGKIMIIPKCIDLPQPITFTANIGGNVISGNGPWVANNLCGSVNQFQLVAVDGLGNPHTLISGSADLNVTNPTVNYGAQSIPSPLTIIHQYMPSTPMCNGSSTVSLSGGYTPYNVILMDMSNNNTIPLSVNPPAIYTANNLCPGNYGLSIFDTYSNPACPPNPGPGGGVQFNFTIEFFDCFVATNDITCHGLCDGMAQLIPIGNVYISNMILYGPSSSGVNIITNQCDGLVNGIVYHASGQQAMCYGQIIEPTPLSANLTVSDCSGYGTNDGSASVTVSGGTPPYSYLWSTGATTMNVNNLASMEICVTVTDFYGCDTTLCDSILEPSQLLIQINNIQHQTSVIPNGAVNFTVTGGVAPYITKLIRYAQNDTINSSFTNLVAGNYAIYVKDANNITATQSFTINNLTGISDNDVLTLKVYPNPVKEKLFVEADNLTAIEIYHISGKLVLQQQLNNESKIEINVSELPAGSYLIKILDVKGHKVLPIIKQ